MIRFIEQYLCELESLCRKYHVARLDLFGSAADGTFDPKHSDLDFLVDFQDDAPMGPFHQYFDFLEELKRLFGCSVDLVERRAMKNPYFINAVKTNQEPLYAA